MQLYQGVGPNSYRVRIFMAEKGIDVPRVEVDIFKGEHKAPDFLKLNSLGHIPVLALDDAALTSARVLLVASARQVLKSGLSLLGIEAPEEM